MMFLPLCPWCSLLFFLVARNFALDLLGLSHLANFRSLASHDLPSFLSIFVFSMSVLCWLLSSLVADALSSSGFPCSSLISFRDGSAHPWKGDRTELAIIDFAQTISAPAVLSLINHSDKAKIEKELHALANKRSVLFIFVQNPTVESSSSSSALVCTSFVDDDDDDEEEEEEEEEEELGQVQARGAALSFCGCCYFSCSVSALSVLLPFLVCLMAGWFVFSNPFLWLHVGFKALA